MRSKPLHLLGAAWGYGARDHGCSAGPRLLQSRPFLAQSSSLDWRAMIDIPSFPIHSKKSVTCNIATLCEKLAEQTRELCQNHQSFLTLGGDHTCAIGTWSGAFAALQEKGPLGLIWFDAHMDAHTPQTTPSGAIHGMPLACLLGYGDKRLTEVMTPLPKLHPKNLCLIGVRSFEAGEAILLDRLKVRIFFMEEVQERGLHAVFQEAYEIATTGTQGYGISIDLDAVDPEDAPGVGSPVPHGIGGEDLIEVLKSIQGDPLLLGAELAEFNPEHDIQQRTAALIEGLAGALFPLGGERVFDPDKRQVLC